MKKEELNLQVVVNYSDKKINRNSLAELFYDIMEQNQREGVNYDTKEECCA